MAKPYMCGDEVAVYIPNGGCDCNYTLQKVDDDNYAAAYKLMLNGSQIGDLIGIPFDKYVKNCVLLTVTNAESPYAGAQVGDLYLDISFHNAVEHIYVPLTELMSGGYKIVEELPTTGDTRYIYLLDDGAGHYLRYVWDAEEQEWIDLGGTQIDLDDYYTKSDIDSMISNIMLRFYPVGSIYISEASTSPSTLFGGTWEQIEDAFLLSAGSTYSAGQTGGEATHTLLTAEMPEHTHNFAADLRWSEVDGNWAYFRTGNRGDSHGRASLYTQPNGASQPHNNMPPYLVVYVWKRTA